MSTSCAKNPYKEYDSEDDFINDEGLSKGEQTLLASYLFQNYDLRLYYDVLINGDHQVDYLICSKKSQLIGVNLSDYCRTPAYNRGTKDSVPTVVYPTQAMKKGDIKALEDFLRKRVNAVVPHEHDRPFMDVAPVPPGLHAKLAELNMIQPRKGTPYWEPTAYGSSLGIVSIAVPNGTHGRRGFYLLPASNNERLAKALKWAAGSHLDSSASFLQKMERLKRGLPISDNYAVKAVQSIADIPLDLYMVDFPDELQSIKPLLAGNGLDETCSYKEAACAIYSFCKDSESDAPYFKQYAKNYILNFTAPLLKASNDMKNLTF